MNHPANQPNGSVETRRDHRYMAPATGNRTESSAKTKATANLTKSMIPSNPHRYHAMSNPRHLAAFLCKKALLAADEQQRIHIEHGSVFTGLFEQAVSAEN
jgi:hypothetical protein